MSHEGATSGGVQQHQNYNHAGYEHEEGGYDQRSSSDEYDGSNNGRFSSEESRQQRLSAQERANMLMNGGGSAGGGGGGGRGSAYSVASTHDYLGYPKDQQPFGQSDGKGLWDDEEKGEELW